MILAGDCIESMSNLNAGSVHCCVTSPPYWGLRDYGHDGQIGLESTPEEYVAKMVEVFRAVWRVLRDDGTLWVNIGDSYAGSWGAQSRPNGSDLKSTLSGGSMLSARQIESAPNGPNTGSLKNTPGLKPKDLVGIPWRLAFALQTDGWYLRQDIIWHKPAPMPESVQDRCTAAHEYMFLLTKAPRYYYDAYAISEKAVTGNNGSSFTSGKTNAVHDNVGQGERNNPSRRNKRSVWSVNTKGYKGAHFACYPPKLIEPCILAGSPETCCAECGKGYERKIEKQRKATRPGNDTKVGRVSNDEESPYENQNGSVVGNRDPKRHVTHQVDLGFHKDCECDTIETSIAVVLDPFGGSGTTAKVAQDNGRDCSDD